MSRPPEPQQGVVYGFARLRVQDVGHQDCHFAWGVELACALALTFGKFAEQIFISPSLSVTGTATRHLLAYWKRIKGEGSVAGVVCCTSDVLIYVRLALEVFATCGLSRSKQRRQV